MKTVYIPKGETVHYESLVTDRLVVKGCLTATYGVKAKHISGNGVICAGTVSADTIRVDELEATSVFCGKLLAKRVEAIEVFATDSAAVSCFLGSFFHSHISGEAFHLLFLNPPYLSVINENGRARHEKRFLVESIPNLVYGGLLVYVIPYYRLTPDICHILCDNFEELSVWRFTDDEFQKFKQVAILGIRKHRDTTWPDTAWMESYAVDPASIPLLSELPEGRYALPHTPLEVKTFRGEKFDRKELERQMRRSNSFAQMLARSELDDGTKCPPLPLSIGQIGLVGGSGMINGLIECDTPHIIKGRIVKAVRTETEEKFNFNGNHIGSEITETITNKMIFNVLTPNGFKSLA